MHFYSNCIHTQCPFHVFARFVNYFKLLLTCHPVFFYCNMFVCVSIATNYTKVPQSLFRICHWKSQSVWSKFEAQWDFIHLLTRCSCLVSVQEHQKILTVHDDFCTSEILRNILVTRSITSNICTTRCKLSIRTVSLKLADSILISFL